MANRTNGISGINLEALGLGDVSKPGTATYEAAQLLLSGKPYTRKEIAEETGVVPPVTSRLVNKFREHGIEVIAEPVREGSRELAFRVVSPPGEAPAPAAKAGFTAPTELPVTGVELTAQGSIHATLTTPAGRVTGLLDRISLHGGALDLTVVGVRFQPGGAQDWVLRSGEEEFVLSGVTFE